MPETEKNKQGLPDQQTVPDYDPTNDMNNNKEAVRHTITVPPRPDLTQEQKERAREVLEGFNQEPGGPPTPDDF